MPLTVFYTKNNVTREFLGKQERMTIYESIDIDFCCDKAEETYDITYIFDSDSTALHLILPEDTIDSYLRDQIERFSKMRFCYHCGEVVAFEKVRDANITYRTELIEKTIEERTEVPIIDILWEDPRFKRIEAE